MAASIAHGLEVLFYFIGISFVLAVVAAYFIVTRSKSHFQVFVLTSNYLVAYWFIALQLHIQHLFYNFYDLLPALALFPVTHIVFIIRNRKRQTAQNNEGAVVDKV